MFPIEKFSENGFAVIEDFMTESEVAEMKDEVSKILKSTNTANKEKAVFSVKSRNELYKTDYFLKSNDNISLFYEEESEQVNKIGHALHTLNPTFQKFTFSEQVKDVARKLNLVDPVVVQSMYIFKNSKIGGLVRSHQDATYLHTIPKISGLGLWMAMDDADEDNGCLQVIVGSHKGNLHNDYQLVRKRGGFGEKTEKSCQEKIKVDEIIEKEGINEKMDGRVDERMNEGMDEGMNEGISLGYKGKEPSYLESSFVPLPVKKGSLVLIDCLLVHSSEANKSDKNRNALTLHLYDAGRANWDPLNWLQPSHKGNFVHLYTGRPAY